MRAGKLGQGVAYAGELVGAAGLQAVWQVQPGQAPPVVEGRLVECDVVLLALWGC